jgi:hypothetical protein
VNESTVSGMTSLCLFMSLLTCCLSLVSRPVATFKLTNCRASSGMWLVTGGFDTEDQENGQRSKCVYSHSCQNPVLIDHIVATKVLKVGEQYPIGRRGRSLNVPHIRVSKECGILIVEPGPDNEDVSRLRSTIVPLIKARQGTPGNPVLKLQNDRKKPYAILDPNGAKRLQVLPNDIAELKDGDGVLLAGTISLK